jgi:hypothetical protein
MVLREQCVNRVEGERVTLVDLWKMYVFRNTDEYHTCITCCSCSGCRKEHTSVRHKVYWIIQGH